MNVKKSLLAVGAFSVIGAAGVAGPSLVSAQTTTGSDSLVTKLAQKFNLKEDEVKAVFDEEKTARNAERLAEQSDRLQDAVDDGDITAEQKTLIENKQKELEDKREAAQDALEQWAEDNDIDDQYLRGLGKGGHGGRGGFGGR